MTDIYYLNKKHTKHESRVVSYIERSSVRCLCWGFTAQSTQLGHVERGQFT